MIKKELLVFNNDISHLLYASPQRALQLNKAYKIIVEEQSYIYGRDTTITPAQNVHKEVSQTTLTGIETPLVGY